MQSIPGTFLFPNRCVRCGQSNPEEKWVLFRDDTPYVSTVVTVRSIEIPICSTCSGQLKRGCGYAVAFGLALATIGTIGARLVGGALGDRPWNEWWLALVVGVIFGAAGGALARWWFGTYFASIGPGGTTIRFRNKQVQEEFDRLNGLT